MAKRMKHDWTICGDEIVTLYTSGLSVRDIIPIIATKHGITYPSGTLTNFLGHRNVLRSKSDAHKLAIARSVRLCELCGEKHVPRNYNQRWCDECTGGGKHTKRVRIHGLPAKLYDKMFEDQEHRCAICRREFESCLNGKNKKTLFVDHDHTTGQVRGLLCPRCNNGMSYIDSVDWYCQALTYSEAAKTNTKPIYVKPPRMRRYVRNVAHDIKRSAI